MADSRVIQLGDDNFDQEVLAADVLVMVDFWAPQCPPCEVLSPVIDRIAADYGDRIKVCKVNVHEHFSLAARYSINMIPTVILFHNGKAADTIVGFKSESDLRNTVDQLLENAGD